LRRLVLVAALLAAGCTKDPCDGVAGTCVSLHVIGDGISAIDQLSIDLSGAVSAPSQTTPHDKPDRESLPIDVGVSISGSPSGSETLHVVGLVGGGPVGDGFATVDLKPGGHFKKTVTLTQSMNDLSMDDLSARDLSTVSDGSANDSGGDAGAANPDLSPVIALLAAGRFGAYPHFLSDNEALVQVVDYAAPQNHHVFDRKGNALPIPVAPGPLPINGGVVILLDAANNHQLSAWHDGNVQTIASGITDLVLSPDNQHGMFTISAGGNNVDVWLTNRAGPGDDFVSRKVFSALDTGGNPLQVTFAANGYFYLYDSVNFQVSRIAPTDTSGTGTVICGNCFGVVPSDDGTEVVTVGNLGADEIGQLGLATTAASGVSFTGPREVGFAGIPGSLNGLPVSYSGSVYNQPVFFRGGHDVAYLSSDVDGGWPTGVSWYSANSGTIVTSPAVSPSPMPVGIYFATPAGAAVLSNFAPPFALWWAPWASPVEKVEDNLQQIYDVRPNGSFLYTSGSGSSATWDLNVYSTVQKGAVPNAAAVFGALFVDDTHALFVDNNSDLRLLDISSFTSSVVQSNVKAFDFHPATRTLASVRRAPSPDPTDGLWIGPLP
jgi:hypothetical protein